ncbi:MAG: thiolase family protein [Chloroflexi bacterium]|jgi:acetyl-CoA acyltransferase|nr:thiolase family protein [Chloroflexota bacterium]MBT3668930.1 thiolase family protein [Chloroflexota bacterium]MBT4002896.1 thiolase family protein [Chloroflexota bacterium]MBT4305343.1 thiolase family protein [Chloroflexota bacterium]MBT4532489.1 thiolase family protein [Chloroflexota bacterium]
MSENNLDPKRVPVIVAAKRTPIGKAIKGALATARPEDLGALVIKRLMESIPEVPLTDIEDVIIGCAMPEGSQGLNLGRRIVLRAGFPVEVPAETVNRFCSSGLQTISQAAMQIMSGMGDVIIAGGVESMSNVPMTGFAFSANPTLAADYPEAYVSMGITAENVADEYDVSRQAQDEFAARSHQRAALAIEKGLFDAETVAVDLELVGPDGSKTITHSVDEGVRADTTAEGLSKLRPVFREGGSVTAGNTSQMSDGAAAVLIMSQAKADEYGLNPLARFVSYAVGGVRPEVMGIGPIVAIPKALEKAGLELADIDLIELNEAFAAQSVAVVNELGLDIEKVNVNGGAIALGHPLGCTGAKLTTQLIHEMGRRDSKYGMVTMCIGGGMGAAGIFENLQ